MPSGCAASNFHSTARDNAPRSVERSRLTVVAAVPSLHGAYPMLLALFFWPRRRWARALLLAYPIAMGVVLVYTAEHYVADILLGWAYAIGSTLSIGGMSWQISLQYRDCRAQEQEKQVGEGRPDATSGGRASARLSRRPRGGREAEIRAQGR